MSILFWFIFMTCHYSSHGWPTPFPLKQDHLETSIQQDTDYENSVDTEYVSDFRWPESYFDIEASSDVAVLVGQTAFLTCRVQVAGNWTVSWVRHRDIHLLTVGTDTYTADRRFRGLHVPSSPEWTLQIKATSIEDAGDYECQLSSTPLRTHIVRLEVIEPRIDILNGPEVYLHEGSTLNLTCLISPAVDASLLLWSQNGQVLNWLYQQSEDSTGSHQGTRIHVYDGRLWVDRGGGVNNDFSTERTDLSSSSSSSSVDRSSLLDHNDKSENHPESSHLRKLQDSGTTTVSHLTVDKTQMHHSGRYVCSTLGFSGTWTLVHVLADEQPAAMQRGNGQPTPLKPLVTCWISLSIVGILRYLVLSLA